MTHLDVIIPAFNAEKSIVSTLQAIFRQVVPENMKVGVVVVDNCSEDSTRELADQWMGRGVRVVSYTEQPGRSGAINAGVNSSDAEYIMVLDADCQLLGENSFVKIAMAINKGALAIFGYSTAYGQDFWSLYHRKLEKVRSSLGWKGWTTACCVISKGPFLKVGGFSTDYQHYGFEDKDLICQLRGLLEADKLVSLNDLKVSHDDCVTLPDVANKMYAAGRYSSEVFIRRLPSEYRLLSYSHVDKSYIGWYKAASLYFFLTLFRPIMHVVNVIIDWKWVPFSIRSLGVKICSALSYFKGTCDREREKNNE